MRDAVDGLTKNGNEPEDTVPEKHIVYRHVRPSVGKECLPAFVDCHEKHRRGLHLHPGENAFQDMAMGNK